MIDIKIQQEVNECFKNIALTTYTNGSFSLLLPVDGRWEKQLPLSVQAKSEFLLTLKNWTHEESEVSEKGILIKAAFGKIENKAWFDWTEVLGILTENLEPIFIRNFLAEKRKYNLKDLMKG